MRRIADFSATTEIVHGCRHGGTPSKQSKVFCFFSSEKKTCSFLKKEPKNFYPLRLGVQVKTPDRRCFAPGVLHQPEGGLVDTSPKAGWWR